MHQGAGKNPADLGGRRHTNWQFGMQSQGFTINLQLSHRPCSLRETIPPGGDCPLSRLPPASISPLEASLPIPLKCCVNRPSARNKLGLADDGGGRTRRGTPPHAGLPPCLTPHNSTSKTEDSASCAAIDPSLYSAKCPTLHGNSPTDETLVGFKAVATSPSGSAETRTSQKFDEKDTIYCKGYMLMLVLACDGDGVIAAQLSTGTMCA